MDACRTLRGLLSPLVACEQPVAGPDPHLLATVSDEEADSQPPTNKRRNSYERSRMNLAASKFSQSQPVLTLHSPPPSPADAAVDNQELAGFSLDLSSYSVRRLDGPETGVEEEDEQRKSANNHYPYSRINSEPCKMLTGHASSLPVHRPILRVERDNATVPLRPRNSRSTLDSSLFWFISRRGGADDDGSDGDLDQCRYLLKAFQIPSSDGSTECRKRRFDDRSSDWRPTLSTAPSSPRQANRGKSGEAFVAQASHLYSRDGRRISESQAAFSFAAPPGHLPRRPSASLA